MCGGFGGGVDGRRCGWESLEMRADRWMLGRARGRGVGRPICEMRQHWWTSIHRRKDSTDVGIAIERLDAQRLEVAVVHKLLC